MYLDVGKNVDKPRKIEVFGQPVGELINAGINVAYQIMKVAGSSSLKIKENEKIEMLNVA